MRRNGSLEGKLPLITSLERSGNCALIKYKYLTVHHDLSYNFPLKNPHTKRGYEFSL
jgi:hypothetical protein